LKFFGLGSYFPLSLSEISVYQQPVGGLVDQLAAVSTHEEFSEVIQGFSSDVVEDAIASQDSQPKRQQPENWKEKGFSAPNLQPHRISLSGLKAVPMG
jgi:hypothetical protein